MSHELLCVEYLFVDLKTIVMGLNFLPDFRLACAFHTKKYFLTEKIRLLAEEISVFFLSTPMSLTDNNQFVKVSFLWKRQ